MTISAQRPLSTSRPQRRGFTLIEVMITVAIVAILARIALPSYLEYTKRGKVTEAFQQLTGFGLVMTQYYQDNRTWATACTGTAAPVPAATTNFTYSCPTKTATTFTAAATGNSGTPVAGFVYTIDQSGVRATTSVPAGYTTSSTCWVASKSTCN